MFQFTALQSSRSYRKTKIQECFPLLAFKREQACWGSVASFSKLQTKTWLTIILQRCGKEPYLWSAWWATASSGFLRSCSRPDLNSYTPSSLWLLELKSPCCSPVPVTTWRVKRDKRNESYRVFRSSAKPGGVVRILCKLS